MTLNEVMTQTADAIREKTGKSEKIAPINFAEEIKSISAGGGESGGESWRYFRLNEGWKQGMGGYILPYAYLIGKYTLDSEKRIGSSGMIVIQFDGNLDALEQVGIDVNTPFITMNQGAPAVSFIEMINAYVADMGGTIEEALSTFGLTEITEEEFYTI